MLPTHLVLQLALLFADFGQSAVWHPPANFRDTVLAACNNAGAGFGECLARQMKVAGASADALAFTHVIHNNGYIEAFRPVAQVSVAEVLYPFRANENYGNFLVNGQPPAIDVDDLTRLPAEAMKESPRYRQVAAGHPQASLWPGDRSTPNTLLALLFADGSQQFIADYRIQDGCHACAVLGQAFFGFSFDKSGKFTRVDFAGFNPRYSFSRITTQKFFQLKPATTFTVVLPGNSWSLSPLTKPGHLQALGRKYQSPNELWTFRTVSTGETTLHFTDPTQRILVTVRAR
ncbi:MAG TPA: protease inhibitor I42 family protein [Bryobacteraceae bacterium]|nr:protease inhibitor I42 family protein [Bryobacteraceae bacterium]